MKAIIKTIVILTLCSQVFLTIPIITPNVSASDTKWEDYLVNTFKHRQYDNFYKKELKSIDLSDYIKKKKIKIELSKTNETILGELMNFAERAYFIDIDGDGSKELWTVLCEGSMRRRFVYLFKNVKGKFVFKKDIDGDINPMKYKNKIYYVQLVDDFETKFPIELIEYKSIGMSLVENRYYHIKYKYDSSKLPQPIKAIASGNYLNELEQFKWKNIKSNTPQIKTQLDSNSNSYLFHTKIIVNNKKNNNKFSFSLGLWLTSVGYAPNEWFIESKDAFTKKFRGINNILHYKDGMSGDVLYGFKFYSDKAGNIFFLKATYEYYVRKKQLPGDIRLDVYKFNQNNIQKIQTITIQPTVQVQVRRK